VIETGLGSVDLGIRSQLGEIERGFFDRAGGPRRIAEPPALAPAAPPAGSTGHERRAGYCGGASASRALLSAPGARPALALEGAGARVGGPDH